jgi:single-strand DNA-binding protein
MTLNKVTLIGRLGKDPEVRRLNGGDRVVSFSLATSEKWKDKQGERQEKTEWHNIVIYNDRLGEVAENYLSKGTQVYIEGKIQTRKWTDKEDRDHWTTEIVLNRFDGQIKLLGSKGEDNRESTGRDDYAGRRDGDFSTRGKPTGTVQKGGAKLRSLDDLDDDIPF